MHEGTAVGANSIALQSSSALIVDAWQKHGLPNSVFYDSLARKAFPPRFFGCSFASSTAWTPWR